MVKNIKKKRKKTNNRKERYRKERRNKRKTNLQGISTHKNISMGITSKMNGGKI